MTTLLAEKREHLTASGIKKLRKSGRLPGIVYGKQTENKMIHISASDFQRWARQQAGGMIELKIEGEGSVNVLLEDVQRHPVTQELLHVDFQQVQTDTAVRTKIPLKLVGTPEGEKTGILQVQSAFIEVEALPKDLPNEIEVDISTLNIGDALHVKDLEIPPNVTVISDPEESLLSIVAK